MKQMAPIRKVHRERHEKRMIGLGSLASLDFIEDYISAHEATSRSPIFTTEGEDRPAASSPSTRRNVPRRFHRATKRRIFQLRPNLRCIFHITRPSENRNIAEAGRARRIIAIEHYILHEILFIKRHRFHQNNDNARIIYDAPPLSAYADAVMRAAPVLIGVLTMQKSIEMIPRHALNSLYADTSKWSSWH